MWPVRQVERETLGAEFSRDKGGDTVRIMQCGTGLQFWVEIWGTGFQLIAANGGHSILSFGEVI